ncbi:MAG: transporter substrate-binding domain-containing protein [Actinomycetota bacterium]|nr:MAG: PAS domain-containing [Actinomycetota bacterium]MDP3629391.1 transporter substrate-binding domain-containing protein [Actinomycetota bacterium]
MNGLSSLAFADGWNGSPGSRVGRCSWRACASIVALTLCLALGSATTAVAAPRVVRVGVYENEPKVFTDKDGRSSGIFIDLIEKIAADEGWDIEYVHGDWADDLAALEEGRIDLMPDVAYTEERDQLFDFHKTPVVESWSYVYAASGQRIDRISQLNGKRVAVLTGSIQETTFREMVEGFGLDVTIVGADSLKAAFELTANGGADAAIANYLFGDYFYTQYGLTKTPIVFNAVPLYFATAQGRNPELLAAIDAHLNTWMQEPNSVYFTILSSYTAKDQARIPVYVFWTLGVIGGLLAISAVLLLVLRRLVNRRTQHLRQALVDLQESEGKYRRLVEGSPDIIYSVSRKRGGLYHSQRVEAVLGYTPEYLAEFPYFWVECIHPDDRSAVDAALEAAQNGEPLDIEYRIKDSRGEWHWLRDRAIGTVSVGDDFITEGVVTDITARKQAEEKVLLLNAELEQRVEERTGQLQSANKELEAFSYSVSHDLRAPLRHINGFVDLLMSRSRGELSDKSRHYLDSIAQAAGQMGALIDDLLAFSRTSRAELRMGAVDMNVAVRDVIASLRDDLDGREVEWDVSSLPDVVGDSAMLRQVWGNLLENAVKYTRGKEPARIGVGISEEADDVVFFVRDNGVGFDMQYASKLFGVFQRLHTSAEFEGTGVGLANVRRIVDRHGGRTWAEAEPDRGATFFFSIPKRKVI